VSDWLAQILRPTAEYFDSLACEWELFADWLEIPLVHQLGSAV
jgi:hypothetical protein